ncbi:MAG: hypothetical protein AAF813_01655 [Pseudomonadota bacterium]
MYHFKATTDAEYEEERVSVIWQILRAQLAAGHSEVCAAYGLQDPDHQTTDDDASPMRPMRTINPTPEPPTGAAKLQANNRATRAKTRSVMRGEEL